MAKKAESRPVVPVTQENTDVTPESGAEVQEGQEPVAGAQEATLEEQEPEQADDSMMTRLEEILNGDTEPAEKDTPQEDDGQQGTEPQEKILFYVKTVNDKTALRSTPEYPMSGAGNIIDVITDRGPYGIVETENGFGRITGGVGWILLDPGVVIRQG